MSWTVSEHSFEPERITTNGNKYMTGNGYMGCRGTLEEFGKEQLAAVTLAGLYDKAGDKWREPVNAPNALFTVINCDGQDLSVLAAEPAAHTQSLELRQAVHRRETVFGIRDGGQLTYTAERFVSMDQLHVLAGRFTLHSTVDCRIVIRTGIDSEVWDINGPHLSGQQSRMREEVLLATAVTGELQLPVAVAEQADFGFGRQEIDAERALRTVSFDAKAGETYEWYKYAAVFTGLDSGEEPEECALRAVRAAADAGYSELLEAHSRIWEERWLRSDVRIEGDDKAQSALRYSIYQLLIIAPTESEKVSIPARGLSGQVYKGAVFWDTEMFMLPFFLHSDPATARNLMMYRIHTLDGARRKAAEYGYLGAFYAWESQDSGDDACTLFNVNDVFTGRPMRTYFRDKQVHISADVVHGIWQYLQFTGDDAILAEGGAEVIYECARFFYSYAYYNPVKQRYEILDVTGPDEYHERVNNNAFTNALVHETLEIALKAAALLEDKYPAVYAELASQFSGGPFLAEFKEMLEHFYVPQPDPDTLIIEQFDRYYQLEEVTLAELKSRIINKHEYLGGGSGLATTTRILKQADVVLMLNLFKGKFSKEVKQANWEFYEPRTEHGSSLSPCIYALVAADIGSPDWGYPYFMRTATVDLTGEAKQYVGDLYIGGTHPAANGGAWMAAVLGFAGLHFDGGIAALNPALPESWQSVELPVRLRGSSFRLQISRGRVTVTAAEDNSGAVLFAGFGGEPELCRPGAQLQFTAPAREAAEQMLNNMKGAIFDLDGVIVDTAKYHYLAWRALAAELGFEFTEAHNERLKGVSRMRSLDILLEIGGREFSDEEKHAMAEKKNRLYVEYISRLDQSELLPGVKDYLHRLRGRGVAIALGSASKNAEFILDKLNIAGLFDAVIDGNKVSRAKPDPEVFLAAGAALGLQPQDCIVFEDAEAGVAAGKAAGMPVVGIGKPEILQEADLVIAGLHEL
ncbi:beta-phosphoglucomutase [Paenibacillus sp. MMS20-IR301]|uniref:beta-phosphoglucomutase n=1 Tax=Paenibacillus sp. MMS20-IR301 TaxID=2895946 RepID=UPI0028E515AF|nr:beta-phosphoglucomutase [Paenibacillus sp. MMS20-IR301]WNS44300.1 beta-phosphoglucomutase [Paenibacillus sp. MMS20-IR301]